MTARIPLAKLSPNPRNPRSIRDSQFQKLCDSIKRDPEFMTLRPIVVDADNLILGGNMRYRACAHLGMKTVPAAWVKVAEDLTEEQRQRFVLVDNAPDGMAGEWDYDILSADWELPELEELGFDKLIIATDFAPTDAERQSKLDELNSHQATVECVCPNCGHEFTQGSDA